MVYIYIYIVDSCGFQGYTQKTHWTLESEKDHSSKWNHVTFSSLPIMKKKFIHSMRISDTKVRLILVMTECKCLKIGKTVSFWYIFSSTLNNRLSLSPQSLCLSSLETAWQSALSWPWNHDVAGSTPPSRWPFPSLRRPRKAWSISMKTRLPLSVSCTA